MTRTSTWAFSAAFACALFVPVLAQAQDNFPDTPANHWAFDALSRLKKDGILVGYPDGLYRGGRPASRYELAAAVHAAYLKVKGSADGLSSQISELQAKASKGSEVTKADLDALKASLDALNASKPDYSKDLADLNKLMKEFEPELTALGANISDLHKDMAAMTARVEALEKRKLPVFIGGEINFAALGGFSQGDEFGITVDGRPTGVGRGDYNTPELKQSGPPPLDGVAHVGPTRDLTVLNEIALTLMDNINPDPTWRIVAVTGNMLGSNVGHTMGGFGDQGTPAFGYPFQEGQQGIYLQNASAKFEGKLKSMPYRVEMGRFDHRVTPYTFQRPDNTPYFTNDRWDSGAWSLDGAMARFGVGEKKITFFAGRSAQGASVGSNSAMQHMTAGSTTPFCIGQTRPVGLSGGNAYPIDKVIGVDLKMPFLKNGEAVATYIMLSSDTLTHTGFVGADANGVNVFGASFNATVAGFIPIHGSYTKTNTVYNNKGLISRDNEAVDLGISGKKGPLGFDMGYRMIGPNFGSAGDWGRIGMWWNPTNVNDFYLKPSIGLGNWVIGATAHYVTGQGKVGEGPEISDGVIPMDKGDRNANVAFTLTRKLGGGKEALVGIESADWHFRDRQSTDGMPATSPKEKWYDFGMSFSKENTTFSILIQVSDYDSNGQFGFEPFGFNSSQTTAHGGLITTQLTTKF